MNYAKNLFVLTESCYCTKETDAHHNMSHSSDITVTPSTTSNFLYSYKTYIKIKIKKKETLNQDPLSIKI